MREANVQSHSVQKRDVTKKSVSLSLWCDCEALRAKNLHSHTTVAARDNQQVIQFASVGTVNKVGLGLRKMFNEFRVKQRFGANALLS